MTDESLPATPPPRRPMSAAKKLWIAGLLFPTLLLLIAAGYLLWIGPQLRLIDKLTSRGNNPYSVIFRVDPPFGQGEIDVSSHGLPRYLGHIYSIHDLEQVLQPEDMQTIGQLQHLKSLAFYPSNGFVESDLEPLTRIDSLTDIDIVSELPITDEGIKILSRVHGLQDLLVLNARDVTAQGITNLQDLQGLTSLILCKTSVTTDFASALRGCKNLTFLGLNYSDVSDEALDHIATLPLKALCFIDSRFSPSAFRKLGSIHSVKQLLLRTPDLLPADAFSGFEGSSQLTTLKIHDQPLADDAMLARIAQIKTLMKLELNGCTNITDRGLEPLHNHPALTDVVLPAQISDDALDQLRNSLPAAKLVSRANPIPN